MARLTGPDQSERVVIYTAGSKKGQPFAQGTPVPLYADSAGTLPADVTKTDGTAIPLVNGFPTVYITATLEIDLFKFPDVADPVVYTSVGGGPVVALHPRTDDLVDALKAQVTALDASTQTIAATAVAQSSIITATRVGIALPGSTPAPIAVMGTSLQSGHGYTANAGGTANLNDTAQYVLGSQSASLTTDGAGTAKTLKRTAFTAISAAGRHPVVWVKVDDSTHLAGLKLYLGDTNLTNSYQWEMKASATQKWITDGGWHRVDLSWGDVITSGTPTRTNITDAQFRVVDDAAGAVTVHFNGWGLAADTTAWPTGVASLTFDDTYASHYTEARRKMDQYGFGGTAYVIQEYFGQAGRLTLTQAKEMQRYSGWEIAGHATTGAIHSARMTSLNASQLATEFAAQRDFMATNGFTGDHTAYPGGEFNDTVLDAAEKYFTAARTTFQKTEVLPPARRSKLKCGGYVTSATTTSSLTAAIDQAYANKEWLIFGFHDIVTTPSASTDYSIANFGTVVDYLATKGIPVRTVGDVLRRAA